MHRSSEPPRLFGTDGVRGVFGRPPLDRATIHGLGFHLGRFLSERSRETPLVLVGGDTRVSTPTIVRWLAAGLAAGGAATSHAGIVPTPALATLARELSAATAAVVSASHNPLPDNGIKLIGGDGFKWPRAWEAELEARLHADPGPTPQEGAEVEADPGLARRYLADLEASLPGGRPLAGLSVVIDAANGAASPFAGRLFSDLGAEVEMIHDRPDGDNINHGCGSTHPETVAAATLERGADLGISFDGDADRALFVDEKGEIRDGDAVLYLWAKGLIDEGRLEPPRIVATSMSNLGLERALEAVGVGIVRCDVGDRVVVETLREQGLELGGEQSGHIVHLGLSTTGDGLLTALQVAHRVVRSGGTLSELLAGFRRYPQLLVNVPVRSQPDLASLAGVAGAARSVEQRLGGDGRLVLRYSGTEPLARIMLEGPDRATIETMAREIAAEIERAIG